MKITAHRPKSKTADATFTIIGVSRTELSIILGHATSDAELDLVNINPDYKLMIDSLTKLLDRLRKIQEYVDPEDKAVWSTPLELE